MSAIYGGDSWGRQPLVRRFNPAALCHHLLNRMLVGSLINLPGVLYYLEARDRETGAAIYKLGITNRSTEKRFGSYLRDEKYYELSYEAGQAAMAAERKIFDVFASSRIRSNHFGPKNGHTEWFDRDVLGMFQRQPQFFDMAVDMACNGEMS